MVLLQDAYCAVIADEFQTWSSLGTRPRSPRTVVHPIAPVNRSYVACVFDYCQAEAAYTLIVRWPDGQVWQRDVCRVHERDGVEARQHSREPAAGKPTITRRVLSNPN